ncbi:MAG: AMP-binding protein [Butyrivibrio sp.]
MNKHLEYPDYSLYRLFENSANSHPDYISCNYFGNRITYGKLNKYIDECARAFIFLGVRKGDCVSICMPNTPEAVISFYALNKIGAVANMIHPLSAENEIKYFLNVSESRYAVVIDLAFNKINNIAGQTKLKKCITVSVKDSMPFLLKTVYGLTKGRKTILPQSPIVMKWKEFIREGRKYTPDIDTESLQNHCPDRTAAILYSGGTTGYPKGIELTNLNFNALAMQSFEACACLKEKDTVLAIMPVFHGFGLGICIHTVQYFGGTSIILPKFSAGNFHKLIRKYKPNIIAGVPTLYEAMLQNRKLNKYNLSFLKCVISGGDSLSVSLKNKVDEFLRNHGANIQIREGYGLTECVTGSCLTPEHSYREGSIGLPYPDTYYKIVTPGTEEQLDYGEEGEILISGPSVMKGYLKDEEETSKVLRMHSDGRIWLYTGDLGYMDNDGYVYFKQRLKRVIVSSGYNIYPQYIENVIDSHPDVLMSCVIGISHPYKIQVAKAFIVLRNGIVPGDNILQSIKAHCEQNLAGYSLPYEYEFRQELPKTLVGKVAFLKLEEEERQKNEKRTTYSASHSS